MEAFWLYTALSCFLVLASFRLLRIGRRNLPPSPIPALPIIGHLHLLKLPLHRKLHSLSQKYGPIFSLRFGNRLVVVVSSPSGVEECFTKNDVVLANRPRFIIGKYIGYNYTTMVGSSYGDHWRNLRRLGAVEIFSASRLNTFLSVRKDEIRRLLLKLSENSRQDFAQVEMKSKLAELSFNIIVRMVAGKRYFGEDEDNDEAKLFRELIEEVFKYAGASNPGDFVPVLRWMDYKNYDKKVAKLSGKMDTFFEGLIDKHRRNKNSSTMIDHLLSLQESQPEYYTDQIIKGLIMRVVGLALGSLIQSFEWKRISEEQIDLAEGNGLTMPKVKPLEAMCKARNIIDKVVLETA
ncbi:hypothetical protein ACH5RR_011481 [Cinchona calisaya]|uniref:Cytochrome P450 n=1 Tax=Cinchona calisaya TaxID=153742 RepID=A0ABD3A8G1_9GENT